MNSPQFWDALAPHHSQIEDNYFDLASVRRIVGALREPVLVVGAGQGLLVAELRKKGLRCDGVDFSAEMIRQAKSRRGLDLFQADARALPFPDAAYGAVVFATGVIDFIDDEASIRAMLKEARRVVQPAGTIFVGFHRFSHVQEEFLKKTRLLRDNELSNRECLQMYLMSPPQMVAYLAKRAGIGRPAATMLLLRLTAFGTVREKILTFKMKKIFRKLKDPNLLIESAPEKQPYRNEAEIRRLFERLAIPLKEIRAFPSCWIVETAMPEREPQDQGL